MQISAKDFFWGMFTRNGRQTEVSVTSQFICISPGDQTSFHCFDANYANEFINLFE